MISSKKMKYSFQASLSIKQNKLGKKIMTYFFSLLCYGAINFFAFEGIKIVTKKTDETV